MLISGFTPKGQDFLLPDMKKSSQFWTKINKFETNFKIQDLYQCLKSLKAHDTKHFEFHRNLYLL